MNSFYNDPVGEARVGQAPPAGPPPPNASALVMVFRCDGPAKPDHAGTRS